MFTNPFVEISFFVMEKYIQVYRKSFSFPQKLLMIFKKRVSNERPPILSMPAYSPRVSYYFNHLLHPSEK